MAKTRVTKKLVANISAEQFNESLSTFAIANAKEAAITAKMDEQMTRIREKYADDLKELAESQEQHREIIQTYCLENKDQLFTKTKSIETAHGKVGFRTGMPTLKTLKGFTWASALTLCKKVLPTYVREKEEINKEALLMDREKADIKVMLADIGVKVEQDEAFYIELKKEEPALV